MKEWFIDQTWEPVYKAESAHEKAHVFQNMLISKLDEIFPEKVRKFSSDDQPWITHHLKNWTEEEGEFSTSRDDQKSGKK